MKKQLYFKGRCPKCNSREEFKIIGCSKENESQYAEEFIFDDWREYDYFLFSISSQCNNCKHLVSANIAAIYDFEKNSISELDDYANSDGELIDNMNLQILFDYPPLLPSQYLTSPISVDTSDLYRQAELCYKVKAWDAVGVVCRRIVDIKSLEMWNQSKTTKPPSTLYQRITQMFGIDASIPIDQQLDFSREDHKIFYTANTIRLLGNDSAHSPMVFNESDAEAILIFTREFLKLN